MGNLLSFSLYFKMVHLCRFSILTQLGKKIISKFDLLTVHIIMFNHPS